MQDVFFVSSHDSSILKYCASTPKHPVLDEEEKCLLDK